MDLDLDLDLDAGSETVNAQLAGMEWLSRRS